MKNGKKALKLFYTAANSPDLFLLLIVLFKGIIYVCKNTCQG